MSKQYGYFYIGRADNDVDYYGIFTKSGITNNPVSRIRGYQTNKGIVTFKYHKIYKMIAVEDVEKLFHDHVTKDLTSMAKFKIQSGGTEVRYTTPEELDERFLNMCEKYDLAFEDVTDNHNKKIERLEKKKNSKKPIYLKDIKPKTVKLFDYQQQIKQLHDIGITETGVKIKDRAHLILPTGSGKTIVCLDYIKGYLLSCGEGRFIVFAPSLSLMNQLYENIRAQLQRDINIIVNASKFPNRPDDRYLNIRLDEDSMYEEITRSTTCIVISTYQSCEKLIYDKKLYFDCAIFDECHQTVGKIYRKNGVMRPRAKLFYNEYIDIGFRLFVTATKKRAAYKKAVTMNDESLFGPLLKAMTVGELVKIGRLTDYEMVSLFSDNESKRENKLVASLKYAFEYFPIKKMIVYCKNKTTASTYFDNIKKHFSSYKVFYIDGETHDEDRQQIFKYFVDEKYVNTKCIVVNIKVLSEGIDLPMADSICYADPKSAELEIVQNIGRILRRSKNKDMSYVFIPAIDGDYDMIKKVLIALVKNNQLTFSSKEIKDCKTNKVDKVIGELVKKYNPVNIDIDSDDNFLKINKDEIKKIVKSIVEEIRGSGIQTSKTNEKLTTLLLFAKEICDDKRVFTRRDFFSRVEKHGFSNFYGGKTPQQSLSRDLTEELTKKHKVVERIGKGKYRLLKDNLN